MSEDYIYDDTNYLLLEDGSEYWIHPEDGLCCNGIAMMKVCPDCKEIFIYCKCDHTDLNNFRRFLSEE